MHTSTGGEEVLEQSCMHKLRPIWMEAGGVASIFHNAAREQKQHPLAHAAELSDSLTL